MPDIIPYCFLSYLNETTLECYTSDFIQSAYSALLTVRTIPTITTVASGFVSFFNLLDDFSYYSFHKRNYSTSITVFMNAVADFTMSRFIPLHL